MLDYKGIADHSATA